MAKMKWKPKVEIEEEEKKKKEQAKRKKNKERARKVIEEELAKQYLLSEDIPEEEKALFVELFDEWEEGQSLVVGEKVSFNDEVYEVIQAHTTQKDWKPKDTPALFNKVYQKKTSEGDEVIPPFVQPIGEHDAYGKGDKVTFQDGVYESIIDGNTWSPSDYPQGWKEV